MDFDVELFSFGSGQYVQNTEADDVMSDLQGRWLCYALRRHVRENYVLLESNRKMGDHLRGKAFLDKARQLQLVSDLCLPSLGPQSPRPKVGNPIASILKSHV